MIYVDVLRPCIRNKNWRYDYSCHLFADTTEELHPFAENIGLKKPWFQNKWDFPHYDLTKSKRIQAIKNGAEEVDNQFVVDTLMANRKKFNLKKEE